MFPHMRGHMMTYRRDVTESILRAAAVLSGVIAAALFVWGLVWIL